MSKGIRVLGPITLVMALTACIHKQVNLIEDGMVVLSQSAPPGVRLSTSVFNEDGKLVVLGQIDRGPLNFAMIPGHVDVTITDDKGQELSSVKARIKKLPTWRHGPSSVEFEAEFPGVPPAGSVVKVDYQTEQHD